MAEVVRLEEDLQASAPEISLALSRAGVSGVEKAVRIRRGNAETVMRIGVANLSFSLAGVVSLTHGSGNILLTPAGFRVPALMVSPWARRGFVSHDVKDHTSWLTFVQWRFGLPPLTTRNAPYSRASGLKPISRSASSAATGL